MRPPQNAGEDSGRSGRRGPSWCRFNEAPAERGGRLSPIVGAANGAVAASMRPPQNAGEDKGAVSCCPPAKPSFNEAPAERGGRLFDGSEFTSLGVIGFNEAPAERGGRLVFFGIAVAGVVASMRPPQNAGEDFLGRHHALVAHMRFNEAPAERGGRQGRRQELAHAPVALQ